MSATPGDGTSPGTTGRGLGVPLLVAAATYLLWSTPFVWPLKIFTVLLHEVSHGLGAVLTGGEVVRIELSHLQGGLCVSRGGSPFVIASAGYLGSAVLGATLLVLSTRTRADRAVVFGIGVLTCAVTLLYIRSAFGFVFGLVAGAALAAAGALLPGGACDLILKVLGVTSSLYAIHDIASDLLIRRVRQSDAATLAALTGVPAIVWGALWILVAAALFVAALRLAGPSRPGRNPRAPSV